MTRHEMNLISLHISDLNEGAIEKGGGTLLADILTILTIATVGILILFGILR